MNKLFINGQFVESKSTEDLDVINPATEEVIDTVTLANEDDAEKAIKGANAAQLEWEKVNIIKRAKIVEALAEKLEKNKHTITKTKKQKTNHPLHHNAVRWVKLENEFI